MLCSFRGCARSVLVLSITAASGPLLGQGPAWGSPNLSVPARGNHATAYDRARDRVVVFGGYDTTWRGDTWEYDGRSWIRRTPSTSPSPRAGAFLVFDAERGRVALLGGYAAFPTYFNEHWEWTGEDWLYRGSTPANTRLFLWHGGQNPGLIALDASSGAPGTTLQRIGSNWVVRDTNGPPGGQPHGCYSPATQRSYVFAWNTATSTLSLQAWDGSSWTPVQQSPSPISGLYGSHNGMVWDEQRQCLVLFDAPSFGTGVTWYGALSGPNHVTWTGVPNLTAAMVQLPSSRANTSMVYDSRRHRSLLFGGLELVPYQPANDFYELTGSGPTGSWRRILPPATPSHRSHAGTSHDPALGRVLLFGGRSSTGATLGDLWSFDGGSWTDHGTSPFAAGRVLPAMAPLTPFGTVVFGGAAAIGGPYFNDTIAWDGSQWGLIPSFDSPPARYGHDMVSTNHASRVFLFGGYGGSYLADTWRLLPSGWTQIGTLSAPPARANHKLAYDARRNRVVLFGGQSASGSFLGDTWELTTGLSPTWTQVAPHQSPQPRWGHAMSYDSARGVVVMTGGYGTPIGGGSASYRSDIWEYDGTSWRLRAPKTSWPLGREAAAFAYHAPSQSFVLQGGYAGPGNHPTEPWTYSAIVDVPGPGMASNSRELRNLSFPVVGLYFTVAFDNPSTFGWLLVDPAPNTAPIALPMLSFFCNSLLLYGPNHVIADAMGNPGRVTFQISPAQLGTAFTCQGLALTPSLCLEFTDPLLVTPQVP